MFVRCPLLSDIPKIRHGFFTREGGVSEGLYASLNCGYGSGDDLEAVKENRSRIGDALGVGVKYVCTAFQIHSDKAVIINEPWPWKDAPEADALVTNTPSIAIAVLTADCLPVLLCDPQARVIAAAHAGWKGAFGGVLESTVRLMQTLGAKPEQIVASIGPAIAQASYEVGQEFYDRLVSAEEANATYFIPSAREGHFLFNLKAYAHSRLQAAGVSHVHIIGHDTYSEEERFFSYRRSCLRGEEAYGRQLSAIILEE